MALFLSLLGLAQAAPIDDFVRMMTTSWSTAPDDFTTSYSPCLDALIVNFRSAGCKVIAQDPDRLGDDSMGLVCTAPRKLNGWTSNEHVIFYTKSHDVTDFKGWDVFCVDPNITMYIPEKKRTK